MIISTEQAKLDTVLDPSKISFLQGVMLPVTIQSYARDLLEARELIKEMRVFCRDVAYNFDCDSDAHKYGTTCRACEAKELYEKSKEYAE